VDRESRRLALPRLRSQVRENQPIAPVDAVKVGALIKRERTFAELRPKRACLALSIILPSDSEALAHPRIARVIRPSVRRAVIFVDVQSPKDIDRHVRAWLAQGWLASPVG